jgi:S-formylglutathione hydrolase FrmB
MPYARRIIVALVAIATAQASAETTIHMQTIQGPHQPSFTVVAVVTPDTMAKDRTYRTLYVLPVEPGVEHRYGSGLQEVLRADIANRHQVICVAPTFNAMPWYADHPTDPALKQERHFLDTVIPWVEQNYPVKRDATGRLLLGFSKSGYGAVMLLLRHSDVFGRAVAWDAPVDKTRPDQFGMIDVFGTDEHFEQYAIPELIKRHGEMFKGGPPRILLMPKRDGDHPMGGVHRQMLARDIPHVYEFTEKIEHRWDSGWIPRAAEMVLEESGN